MTENLKVHFVELMQEEYDKSVAHSASTLYYCQDTKKMYKGDLEYGASGNNDFVVNYTVNDGIITADKPLSEIKAAYDAGKHISAFFNGCEYTVANTPTTSNIYYARLGEVAMGGNEPTSVKCDVLLHTSNNSVNNYIKTIALS